MITWFERCEEGMSDIVELLRHPFGAHEVQLRNWCMEAADEIERLRGEKSYLKDEVIPALRSENNSLRASIARLQALLPRWYVG